MEIFLQTSIYFKYENMSLTVVYIKLRTYYILNYDFIGSVCKAQIRLCPHLNLIKNLTGNDDLLITY